MDITSKYQDIKLVMPINPKIYTYIRVCVSIHGSTDTLNSLKICVLGMYSCTCVAYAYSCVLVHVSRGQRRNPGALLNHSLETGSLTKPGTKKTGD